MSHQDELLDIKQAAQFLHVSEISLRRWTNAGLLPCLRVGGRRERRFRRADLLAFVEEGPAGEEAEPRGASRRHHTIIDGIPVRFGTHFCGLYASDLGQVRQAVGFLAGGLRPRNVCFLAARPDARDAILAQLEEKRPALRTDIAAGRLVFCEYTGSGQSQLQYWEAKLRAAVLNGAKALRVIGDLREFDERIARDALLAYEAEYDERVAKRFPVVTLCQYDVRRFSSLSMLHALKGHPDSFRYPAERLLS
jgi:transcriptional repressor of dcmA and dcmR